MNRCRAKLVIRAKIKLHFFDRWEMQALNQTWIVELVISGGYPGDFWDFIMIDEEVEPVSVGAFFLA